MIDRQHINLRLERWHRRSIYASCAWLVASGLLWLLAHYFLRPVSQFGESIHPLEAWSMKLHGAGAMVMLLFIGSLMNAHMRRALKSGRNLYSGWSMIGSMLTLIATGYGLYYLAGESDRPIWSVIHWGIGVALPLVFVLHIFLGRRKTRSIRSHPPLEA